MTSAPLRIEEPRPSPPPRGFALFRLGFRPFYLLAALFGALAIALWMGAFHGMPWRGTSAAVLWHQHEMVFGFALAVITGFLLTAGRLWTGRTTPEGWPLALLALHWLAARVLMYSGPSLAAAIVDGAFPFVVAAVMARAIVGAGNRRNYFVVALLAALGASNLWFHLAPGGGPVRAALWLVIGLVVVMAGRVVPSFTANALPQAGVQLRPQLDRAALAATVAAFAADVFAPGGVAAAVAPLAFVAALLHVARQQGWRPLATRGRPILWILHLSHAWIPVGFALLGLASLGLVSASAAAHAFGAGAMGGLIIAMITRTALGHTGRPLVAGKSEVVAYVLVHVAAALRLFVALVPTSAHLVLMGVSAALWCTAFFLYFVTYAPRLAAPRLDGKAG